MIKTYKDCVRDELIEAKLAGLVTIKPTPEDTVIVKYTRKCMYDNLWNDTIIKFARGHSFDSSLEFLLCNPFPKTFNPGEKRGFMFPRDTLVNWEKKFNGYMLSATNLGGQLYISTTGTTTSDFAVMGRNHLLSPTNHALYQQVMDEPGFTFIFEVCDPSDPHIVPETPGLVLLGVRMNNVLEADFNRYITQKPRPFDSLVKEVAFVEHEGFMCWKDDRCTKLKSPFYQVLKRIARSSTYEKMKAQMVKCREDFWDHPVFGSFGTYNKIDAFGLFGLSEQDRLTHLRNIFSPLLQEARKVHD